MSKEKNEAPKTENNVNEEVARETWDSWVNELEEQKQPTCNIENPDDCEACGS
tara:strand:- start:199 stop:357 length:159 start_codon:yes stop_codon:yes gene_type:complete